MNKLILLLTIILLAMASLTGCGSTMPTVTTTVPHMRAANLQMDEACSHATLRQSLGLHGFRYQGGTYFCGGQ